MVMTATDEMSQDDKFTTYVDEIMRAIGNKVDRARIEAELKSYLYKYMTPVMEAKRSIVLKYGGNLAELKLGVEKFIANLLPNEIGVDLLCRVLSVASKDVEKKDGTRVGIFYGILGDQSGVIPFTAWKDFGLSKGDVIRIRNASVRGRGGAYELNLGDRTTITHESSDMVPSIGEGRIQAPAQILPGIECKINEIKGGMSNIVTTGRILSIEPREISIKDERKVIYKGVLGDTTGKIKFTAWEDLNLSQNDVIKISGVYSKSWRGIPELNIDARAKIERLAPDALPPIETLEEVKVVPINAISELGTRTDVCTEGIILDVKNGSGLIFRCPECNRVLQKDSCMVHGDHKLDKHPDLRVKAVLDDGTGSIAIVLGKEQTEQLLGKSLEECMKLAQEKMDCGIIKDELSDLLIARPLRVKGNVTSDDFGLMLLGNEVEQVKVSVREEAEKLMQELEV
jgi:replication factor A1